MMIATVAVVIPASAATKTNVMGNSDKNKQFAGEGNVFYYDYHKYVSEKSLPVTGSDQGESDTYMLRIGANGGSGTAGVCDGDKASGLSHNRPDDNDTVKFNGKLYDHAFGYSFKNPVTVDEVKFYLPTNSDIESIDVYGAVLSGTTYGKDLVKNSATTYLGTFNPSSGYAGGAFEEALKIHYVFFALNFKSGTSGAYSVYEIELYGLESGAADFSALKTAIANYNKLSSKDYEADSWATLAAPLATAQSLNKSALSTQTDINNATTALNNAMNALVKVNPNKVLLKDAIAQAKAINASGCTEDSYADLQAKLAAAEAVLNAEVFDDNAAITAYGNLNNALAALVRKVNVMGNSDANTQFAGNGNVFYYDYYKYVAAKGYTAGQAFPTTMNAAGDQGKEEYMLRLGTISGSGTASVCDGVKDSGSFDHARGDIIIGTKTYGHAFGYSFMNPVTVDQVMFYLPANTAVESIDVYGAVRSGTTYGREAQKVLLGTFSVPSSGIAGGSLTEAYKVDYIFFAVNFKSGTSGNYKFYEIELYGLDKGAADFSALKNAIANYGILDSTAYEPDSFATLATPLANAKEVNKNCLATQADVDAAAKALTDAIAALVVKKADKTALQTAIDSTASLVQTEYTEGSWANLEEVLAEADEIMKNDAATQDEVDQAVKDINTAVKRLMKAGDKGELETKLAEAKELKQADYNCTPLAWFMLEKAITAAEEVMANKSASAIEVSTALDDLATAIKNIGDSKPAESETQAPETQAPETQAPETQAPETQAPETQAPETQAPETQAPATQAPATQAPATQAPATQAPATQAPQTQAPITELPETLEPSIDTMETGETGTETMSVTAKGACGSSIAVSALAVVGVIGTAVVLKKKED